LIQTIDTFAKDQGIQPQSRPVENWLLQVEVQVEVQLIPKNPKINPRPRTQPKQQAGMYVASPCNKIGLQ